MSTQLHAYETYREALHNPVGLTEDDLLRLIDQYPYSQPLRYAWVRRKTLLKEVSQNFENALLYASDAGRLHDYAHRPVETVEELEPVFEDYVPFEEYEDELGQDAPFVSADEEPDVLDSIGEGKEHAEDREQGVLDKLVQGGSITGDYFVFEQKEHETLVENTEEKVEVEASEEENISLYNDELMPYSFRWWLHKTRLEHADTYQPFATPVLSKPQKGQFDPQKLDEAILDQQIKEHIIHFQDPEMKLSDAVKNKPVEEAGERKDTKIIEKFIREEPVIQPPSPAQLNMENMARQSAEDSYTLVTETLANIYVDQGLYLKGIEVFKKLILKYPEKKSYFATRIQELEKNL